MLDIVFIILHYNTTETTINCINSIIKNIDCSKYKIVIVDNNSQNNSYLILTEYFKNNHKIDIIRTKYNLGYANGNNFGIKYVRKKYNFKFLCCCNNDILLKQTNFVKVLKNTNLDPDVGIIGPKVYLGNGNIQVYNYNIKSIEDYIKDIKKLTFYKNHYFIYTLKEKIKLLLCKMKKADYSFFEKKHYNILIHGCMIIFTPTFFERLNGFNTKTFLFKEEELLFLMLKRERLKTFYYPDLFITHLEDVSTNSISKSNKEKINFIYTNQIKSLNILIEELKNE